LASYPSILLIFLHTLSYLILKTIFWVVGPVIPILKIKKLKLERILRNKPRLACLLTSITELGCWIEQCDCKVFEFSCYATFSACYKIRKSSNSWAKKDLRDDLVQTLHLISSQKGIQRIWDLNLANITELDSGYPDF